MSWSTKRKHPYTEAGVLRLSCIRCGSKPKFQWQICSDGNNFRPLCVECDVALNRLVLEWMGHPKASELADRYESEKKSVQ
jgi:hypothetical protein